MTATTANKGHTWDWGLTAGDAGMTDPAVWAAQTPVASAQTSSLTTASQTTTTLSSQTLLSVTGATAQPVTLLHYAPNANIVNGVYAPGAAGFNLADVSSAGELNALPTGVKGLVWLDNPNNGADAAFIAAVTPLIGNPKLYGFYLADEPDPTGTYGPQISGASLAAEVAWIHANVPGAITFMTEMNNGTPTSPVYYTDYGPANTGIDLYGLDPYPVRPEFSGGINLSVIPDAVAAAEAAGIAPGQIVPVYQAFGGGDYTSYTLPTGAQEESILAAWGSLVPNPAFDYAYAWGTQGGDTALVSSPDLQIVFAAHNAGAVAPSVTINPIAGSGTINAGGAAAGFSISGTTSGVEPGQTVTATIVRAANAAIDSFTAVVGIGTWSVNVTSAQAQALADGGYTVTADVSNAAGVPAAEASVALTVDETAPTVTSVATSGSGIAGGAGDLNAGHTITLTAKFSEAVTVVGGPPTLSLNDNGTASYRSGAGTSVLMFTYKVAAGQNTPDLTVTAFNLNGGTVVDAAGNGAITAGAVTNPLGMLQIDTTAPVVAAALAVDTGIPGDGITANDALTGTGDPNVIVTFSQGSTILGTTTASGSGVWNFTPASLSQGGHTIVARETDQAGNTGTASVSFVYDSTVPTIHAPAPSTAGLGSLEGPADSLTAATPVATFTVTGGLANDAYAFGLSGPDAGSFAIGTSGMTGTLSIGAAAVAGASGGKLYALSVQATDTTSGVAALPMSVDVVVGTGAGDTINLARGSANLAITAATPTFAYGLGGNDTISASGMTAHVWLAGGGGGDTLTGGSGGTTYLYGATSESTPSAFDIITNFNVALDRIDLTGIGAGALQFQSTQLSGTSPSIAANTIAWQRSSGKTFVYVNNTAASERIGSANMELQLTGSLTPTGADFIHH